MDIVVDVGNSTVQIGFYQNDKIIKKFGFVTDSNKSVDELIALLLEQNRINGINADEAEYLLYSSVVPTINFNLTAALQKIYKNASYLSMANKIKTGLAMKCDNPSEVGQDLIADMVAAKEKYGYPTIVVDLGTASKVLLIDKDGFFSSAAIMPGLVISAKSLFDRGEQLPNISLTVPKKMIGRNTIDSMNIGIIYGHLDGFKGIVNRTEEEIGYKCKKILTGGASFFMKDIIDDNEYIVDEDLCTDGLNLILKRNK